MSILLLYLAACKKKEEILLSLDKNQEISLTKAKEHFQNQQPLAMMKQRKAKQANQREVGVPDAYYGFYPAWDSSSIHIAKNGNTILLTPLRRLLPVVYTPEFMFARRLRTEIKPNGDVLQANIVEIISNQDNDVANKNEIFTNIFEELNNTNRSSYIRISDLAYRLQIEADSRLCNTYYLSFDCPYVYIMISDCGQLSIPGGDDPSQDPDEPHQGGGEQPGGQTGSPTTGGSTYPRYYDPANNEMGRFYYGSNCDSSPIYTGGNQGPHGTGGGISPPDDDWGQELPRPRKPLLPKKGGITLDTSLDNPKYARLKCVVEFMLEHNEVLNRYLAPYQENSTGKSMKLTIKVGNTGGFGKFANCDGTWGNMTITFTDNDFQDLSLISAVDIAFSFLHEAKHAYWDSIVMEAHPHMSSADYTYYLAPGYPNIEPLLKEYLRRYQAQQLNDVNPAHHNLMADHYRAELAEGVMEFVREKYDRNVAETDRPKYENWAFLHGL
ncbi:MAG: hypothetical protein SFU27_10640, partial [Thermonemataceae bacterium]|nr:hypothetical protein [Thermonemataceae bacterium]